jgi:hypothetical protein
MPQTVDVQALQAKVKHARALNRELLSALTDLIDAIDLAWEQAHQQEVDAAEAALAHAAGWGTRRRGTRSLVLAHHNSASA